MLAPAAPYHCFGDWLDVGDPTPPDVIYTAFLAHSTELLGKVGFSAADRGQRLAPTSCRLVPPHGCALPKCGSVHTPLLQPGLAQGPKHHP